MERQILIANSRDQKKYKFTSTAETLGELKTQLSSMGVDYSGLDFNVGIANVKLLNDDAQLPTNIMYNGMPTNDLVIMLTNNTKNISSGNYPTDRKAFGQYIKNNNLGAAITAKFNQNWTRVSTANLIEFFKSLSSTPKTEASNKNLEEVRKELNSEVTESVETSPLNVYVPHKTTVQWLCTGIENLINDRMLFVEDVEAIKVFVVGLAETMKESKLELTDSVVDEILAKI